MGFGILIFGYFLSFAFSISQYYFFADIIGAVVMLFAFSKLAEYNRYFVAASISCLGFLLMCVTSAASLMFELYDMTGPIDMAVDSAKLVFAAIMHVFVFLGIRGIALGAENPNIANRAGRNLVMTMVYYISSVAILLFSSAIPADLASTLGLSIYFYWLLCIVINLVLFYSCFGKLCPADEDEDEVKRSRFEIVNKINDKFDEIEAKKNEYRKESMRLAMEEADRIAAEKAKRHPHSNKKKKK